MEIVGWVIFVVLGGYALWRQVADNLTRDCPNCGQRIKQKAALCPFCAYRFREVPRRPE